ncbi:murein hydrolase activator EnvC family protein [Streptomyces roseolilacinus]|uniref:murein hydrolase activator EnvC family protein n=1 Tax=Streptomyces roseolilacinus TaxID=66904 RepID=UPI00167887CC|nr:peptidoglycan DD-metalloendopeptidase family protein [Streptomyces roseolilacinus]
MRLPHGRRSLPGSVLFAPAVLIALSLPAAAVPAAGPDVPAVSTEVARLLTEASRVTEAYERGRHAAAAQRVSALRLQGELDDKRRHLAVLHGRAGEVARAQYRTGGSLPPAAGLLLADDPEDALRAARMARQAGQAVDRLVRRTDRAERLLEAAVARARTAWRDLEARHARLAAVKRDLEARLERARWRLQAVADRSVAAGSCRGAARLEQPGGARGAVGPERPGGARGAGAPWVAPVSEADGYELSAGFDSTGKYWAHRHTGQDFAVGVGTPVRSIGAGRVHAVSCGGAFGIEVVVRHTNGWYSQYAHLASTAVGPGQPVAAGQWVGQAGTTGNSTGPHLHFEVRLTPHLGSGVDPLPWLREHGVELGGRSRR